MNKFRVDLDTYRMCRSRYILFASSFLVHSPLFAVQFVSLINYFAAVRARWHRVSPIRIYGVNVRWQRAKITELLVSFRLISSQECSSLWIFCSCFFLPWSLSCLVFNCVEYFSAEYFRSLTHPLLIFSSRSDFILIGTRISICQKGLILLIGIFYIRPVYMRRWIEVNGSETNMQMDLDRNVFE